MSPIPVPPELRPRARGKLRGPKCVRGSSLDEDPAPPSAIEKYSSISEDAEENDSVAARVKKRLQRVSKH